MMFRSKLGLAVPHRQCIYPGVTTSINTTGDAIPHPKRFPTDAGGDTRAVLSPPIVGFHEATTDGQRDAKLPMTANGMVGVGERGVAGAVIGILMKAVTKI